MLIPQDFTPFHTAKTGFFRNERCNNSELFDNFTPNFLAFPLRCFSCFHSAYSDIILCSGYFTRLHQRPVGLSMPGMDNQKAKVIVLK